MIKVVTTVEGTNAIEFPAFYPYFWIKNIGVTDVQASEYCDVSLGSITNIPVGEAVRIDNGDDLCAYIIGAGTVEIHAQEIPESPFKLAASASGGGGTEDTAARNAIAAHTNNSDVHFTFDECMSKLSERPTETVLYNGHGFIDLAAPTEIEIDLPTGKYVMFDFSAKWSYNQSNDETLKTTMLFINDVAGTDYTAEEIECMAILSYGCKLIVDVPTDARKLYVCGAGGEFDYYVFNSYNEARWHMILT